MFKKIPRQYYLAKTLTSGEIDSKTLFHSVEVYFFYFFCYVESFFRSRSLLTMMGKYFIFSNGGLDYL